MDEMILNLNGNLSNHILCSNENKGYHTQMAAIKSYVLQRTICHPEIDSFEPKQDTLEDIRKATVQFESHD